MTYFIEYSPRSLEHLKTFKKYSQGIILDGVDEELEHEPDRPSAKRKKLRQNVLAPWELRLGNIRVFYRIEQGSSKVIILAIGHKVHNVLFIAGQEFSL